METKAPSLPTALEDKDVKMSTAVVDTVWALTIPVIISMTVIAPCVTFLLVPHF